MANCKTKENKRLSEKVFDFIKNNPECEVPDILKEITGEDRQLVKYHVDQLVKKGLVSKSLIHSSVVYSISFDEDEIKRILPKLEEPIKEIFSKVSGLQNPQEAVKQIISAYIDVLVDEDKEA